MSRYYAFWLALAIAWFSTIGAVAVPGCQTVAPQQKNLSSVRTALISVPNTPFGVVYSLNKDIAFVALNSTLGVLNTTAFAPSLLHQITLPAAYQVLDGAGGITLTHDGRYVLVSLGTGAIVVDVAKAVSGSPSAVVGALNGTAGSGAIEVIVTADDKYVFVSQEYGIEQTGFRGGIEVFSLHKPTNNGSVSGTYVGFLALEDAVVGTAFSPDGSILYATSEVNSVTNINATQGSLSLIDVAKLKTDPTNALISNTTDAGCGPVRVAVSEKQVWVTARESNKLLAFDSAKLLSSPTNALIASIQVGTSPVGLILAKNGTRILTADSNRFMYTNTTTGLSVVDVHAALQGKEAVFGRISTGNFPRELAISPDGNTILVSDYNSDRVQAVDVDTLP
jgi:DNA-binding beta-propeller fold protein YncE